MSAATLCRVTFPDPGSGELLLALERTATGRQAGAGLEVSVTARPFGGAVRLNDPDALEKILGPLRYDSGRSQAEGDFRLLIDPEHWPAVRIFCIRHLRAATDRVLEARPERELQEEFYDALGLTALPKDFQVRRGGIVVEDQPRPTRSPRATGMPTLRVYQVCQVIVRSPSLIRALLDSSQRITDSELEQKARREAESGGRGRTSAALTLLLADVKAAAKKLPAAARGEPFLAGGHRLEGNVMAVLTGVKVPRYRFLDQ